ncbi:MAG: DEAD/DEAH box helicase [Cyanobacteriota bacterium]
MESFVDLGLANNLIEGLKKANITTPTEIQEIVIPVALENKNLIVQSETGSGKTLAYLLPIFQKNDLKGKVQTIILAPTHELASQIKTEIELLSKNSESNVTYALIIGEVNIKRQIDKLKEKPHIIVGSAGRILELIEKKKINVNTIKTLVIDEVDRMLDKNNLSQVKKVIDITPKEKQTIFVSANVSEHDMVNINKFTTDLEVIKTSSVNNIPSTIKHFYYVVNYNDKIEVFRKLINYLKPKKSLVFIQNGDRIDNLIENNKYHGLKVAGFFGTKTKEERKKIIDDFKKERIQILFSTDIASRGLDIKGVTHVFNLDLNRDPQTYLHRVGRTGRNNDEGVAISLITKDEKIFIDKIAKNYNIEIKLAHIS